MTNNKKYMQGIKRLYSALCEAVGEREATRLIVDFMRNRSVCDKDSECTWDDKNKECKAKGKYCRVHNPKPKNAENESKEKEPIDKPENSNTIKLTRKQKIIAEAFKKAKTEPPNYFELSGRDSNFPPRWKATKFKFENKETDHLNRHGKGIGANDKNDYVDKAKKFLHSPLGETGDVFVGTDNKIYKYDYKTKHFAVAYSTGVIATYWNLGDDKNAKIADGYWEKQKREFKEV